MKFRETMIMNESEFKTPLVFLKNYDTQKLWEFILNNVTRYIIPYLFGGLDHVNTIDTKKYFTIQIFDRGMNYKCNHFQLKIRKGV